MKTSSLSSLPLLCALLLFTVSCKEEQVGVDTSQNEGKKPPSATSPKEKEGTIDCDALFASHGHCFVPRKEKIHNVKLGGSPRKGGKTPLVTIVEFTDFQCPACQRFSTDRLPQLLKKYKDDLAVVFKHYPLSFHPEALVMSQAAQEVRAQKGEEVFWRFHNVLFTGPQGGAPLDKAWIRSQAQKVGLDMAAYDAALKSGKHKASISKDMDQGKRHGLEGTPWIFVNGRLSRKKSVEQLIEETLQEAKAAVAAGTPRERIYSFITDHGAPLFEKQIPHSQYQQLLGKFKKGFLEKCHNQSRGSASFYGYVFACTKEQKRCAPFLKCIEEKVYK